jgi:hypothetical protein
MYGRCTSTQDCKLRGFIILIANCAASRLNNGFRHWPKEVSPHIGLEITVCADCSSVHLYSRYQASFFDTIYTFLYAIFRRVCKIAKRDYYLRHVCRSVRPYATTLLPLDGFSLTLNIFRKSVQKFLASLQSDKKDGHFTWGHMYIYEISLNSS